jgi:anti-sigma B factor antagonist
MHFSRVDAPYEVILQIDGELDAVTVGELRPLLDALVAERPPRVRFDLSGLRLIDSSGVGALVSAYKRLRAQGSKMVVIGVSEQPRAIFRLLRLDLVFRRAEWSEEAQH